MGYSNGMIKRVLFSITLFYSVLLNAQAPQGGWADSLYAYIQNQGLDLDQIDSNDINQLKKHFETSNEVCKYLNVLIFEEDHYNVIGEYEKSLEVTQKIRSEFSPDCDSLSLIISYVNEAQTYIQTKEFEKAENTLDEGFQVYNDEWGNTYELARLYNSRGHVADKIRDNEQALNFYSKSLEIHKELGDIPNIQKGLFNVAVSLYWLGMIDSAKYCIQDCLSSSKTDHNPIMQARVYNFIAAIKNHEGSFDQAMLYMDSALAVVLDNNIIIDAPDMYLNKSYAYYGVNRYQEAYDALHEAYFYKDTVYNLEKAKALATFNERYSLSQKDNEIKQLKIDSQEAKLKENALENSRNWITFIAVVMLIVSVGLVIRFFEIKKKKNQLSDKNKIIQVEREKSDKLLLNILPEEVAQELKETGFSKAKEFPSIPVLFTDFVGFTVLSSTMSPNELIEELNVCFNAFDQIIGKYQLEKIKTIGDAYMAAGGLPISIDDAVTKVVQAAIEMQLFVEKRKERKLKLDQPFFEMRAGIHTGPVVAGIVGEKKFQYDIWGDTVNTASRMESHGITGKVNISLDTYKKVKDDSRFKFTQRNEVEVKGKGKMEMWIVEHKS
ncbi:MAG: hypothetical protein N4A46_12940 [Schleiferiaceae bacterium]|jgi:class 3 adenylate cyclase|nr:hypothetical protein [Schleiferiaceae bacterium]